MSVRFLRPWFRSLLPHHSPLDDALPWMTFRAIHWLRSYLGPGMSIFEYGSGGSTAFFARRVRSVISIEHDRSWHAKVVRALADAGLENVDVRLIPPDPPSPNLGGAGRVAYAAPELAGRTFEAYVTSIDSFADGTFDLVSVDGYARPSCLAHAMPKVRRGGYLLLDNSDWRVYAEAVASLAHLPRTDFDGVGPFQPTRWRTSVWRI